MGAGGLFYQKNFSLRIRVFVRFSASYPEYKPQIYGKGNKLEKLMILGSSLNLQDKVEFPFTLLEDMNLAAMFVLPSDYEDMRNVLLEAMCMGVSCTSTDSPSGGSREMIQDGVNGLLVPVGDEDTLVCGTKKWQAPHMQEILLTMLIEYGRDLPAFLY